MKKGPLLSLVSESVYFPTPDEISTGFIIFNEARVFEIHRDKTLTKVITHFPDYSPPRETITYDGVFKIKESFYGGIFRTYHPKTTLEDNWPIEIGGEKTFVFDVEDDDNTPWNLQIRVEHNKNKKRKFGTHEIDTIEYDFFVSEKGGSFVHTHTSIYSAALKYEIAMRIKRGGETLEPRFAPLNDLPLLLEKLISQRK